jgi:orotate phosphoribosyltransferase
LPDGGSNIFPNKEKLSGRLVLVVEDEYFIADEIAEALREAGAEVVGVAVIVDRGTGAREAVEAAGLAYRFAVSAHDLGLA